MTKQIFYSNEFATLSFHDYYNKNNKKAMKIYFYQSFGQGMQ